MRFRVFTAVLLVCVGSVVGHEGFYGDSDEDYRNDGSESSDRSDSGEVSEVGERHSSGNSEKEEHDNNNNKRKQGSGSGSNSEEHGGSSGGNQNIGCAARTCATGWECYVRDKQPICRPIPTNTCSTHRCKPGYSCQMQKVQCVRAPCPPLPRCMPSCLTYKCPMGQACALSSNGLQVKCNAYSNRCALMRCYPGKSCQVRLQCTREKCVPIFECVPSCNGFHCKGGQQCEMRDNKCPPFMTLQYPPKICHPKVPQCVNKRSPCFDHECESDQHCEMVHPSCPPPPPDHKKPYCASFPRCVNNPSCANKKCDRDSYCTYLHPKCARPQPWEYIWCGPIPHCRKKPTCAEFRCTVPGTVCRLKEVICKKEPCLPVRECVPSCTIHKCPDGQACSLGIKDLQPKCTPYSNPCTSVRCRCGRGTTCRVKLVCSPDKCQPTYECVPSCNGFQCDEGQNCEMTPNICPKNSEAEKCYPAVPKCVQTPSCLDFECEPNQHCDLQMRKCSAPPDDWVGPWCPPVPTCINNPTCKDKKCEKGSYCQLLPTPCARPVEGVYNPCYPRPSCMKPTCANFPCPKGQTCQLIRPSCPKGQTCIPKPTCVDRFKPCASTTCPSGYSCKIKSGECKDYGDSVRGPVEICYPKPYCALNNDPCRKLRPRCASGLVCQPTRTQCLRKPCNIVAKCVPPPCRLAKPGRGFKCVNKEGNCGNKPCPLVAIFKPSCISKTCDDATSCYLRPKKCDDEPCDLEARCVSDPCKLTGNCPRG